MFKFLLVCCLITLVWSKKPNPFTAVGPASPDEPVSFTLALPHRNIDKLESIVDRISNPKSGDYANWLSHQQVLDIVAPSPSVSQEVVQWLRTTCSASSLFSVENWRDAIRVKSSVDCAERLFKFRLVEYRHHNGHTMIRNDINGWGPQIPSEMKNHIQLVEGFQLLPLMRSGVSSNIPNTKKDPLTPNYGYIIPETLKRVYGIPQNAYVNSKLATQTVVEFSPVQGPFFTDLQKFATETDEVFTNITRFIGQYDQGAEAGESTLDVEYITTVASKAETAYFQISDGWIWNYAVQLFNLQNPPLVHSISYGWPEALTCGSITNANCTGVDNTAYIKRTNEELVKVAARGISVIVCAQDEGAPSENNESCGLDDTNTPLWPIYPAAAPHVTTVSSTVLLPDTTEFDIPEKQPPICQQEYHCDNIGTVEHSTMPNNTYYSWTTGGGFSNIAPQPSYQKSAVSKYLSSSSLIPPKQYFQAGNRAYPDIAAIGSRILIVQEGQVSVTAGTSASTPIIAGIITLLNDWRLSNGKKQLGFLNHLLYQMKDECPECFNHVPVGNNKGTIDIVCKYGYGVEEYWNPVVGLGTPRYDKMLDYIKKLP
jgi:tripeptidyl-peptidase-1